MREVLQGWVGREEAIDRGDVVFLDMRDGRDHIVTACGIQCFQWPLADEENSMVNKLLMVWST